jgi:hypothetical protein
MPRSTARMCRRNDRQCGARDGGDGDDGFHFNLAFSTSNKIAPTTDTAAGWADASLFGNRLPFRLPSWRLHRTAGVLLQACNNHLGLPLRNLAAKRKSLAAKSNQVRTSGCLQIPALGGFCRTSRRPEPITSAITRPSRTGQKVRFDPKRPHRSHPLPKWPACSTSSSPRRCANGLPLSAPGPPISCLVALGRTAAARAFNSKAGGAITIRCAYTSACGRLRTPDPLRRPRRP